MIPLRAEAVALIYSYGLGKIVADKIEMEAFMDNPCAEREKPMLRFASAATARLIGVQLHKEMPQLPGCLIASTTQRRLAPVGFCVRRELRARAILEALQACAAASKSRWQVALGKLSQGFCSKKRAIFTIDNRQELWAFLRAVRTLARKYSLSAGSVKMRPLRNR